MTDKKEINQKDWLKFLSRLKEFDSIWVSMLYENKDELIQLYWYEKHIKNQERKRIKDKILKDNQLTQAFKKYLIKSLGLGDGE